MKCPHCKDKDLVMSERKGVEIDYCPDCRGIWLDRGELDKILEKSRLDEAPQASAMPNQGYSVPPSHQPHPGNPYRGPEDYSGQKYYKKRRKSFFEELFD